MFMKISLRALPLRKSCVRPWLRLAAYVIGPWIEQISCSCHPDSMHHLTANLRNAAVRGRQVRDKSAVQGRC